MRYLGERLKLIVFVLTRYLCIRGYSPSFLCPEFRTKKVGISPLTEWKR